MTLFLFFVVCSCSRCNRVTSFMIILLNHSSQSQPNSKLFINHSSTGIATPIGHESIQEKLYYLFGSSTTNLGPSALRGRRPVGIVDDVGKYFPFENREEPLAYLMHCLQDQYEWWKRYRGQDDSNKAVAFTVCHGMSGVGKTTFVTDGFRHVVSRQVHMTSLN